MKIVTSLALIFSLCATACAQAPANRVIYVGTGGSDSAPGTEAQPRHSIQKAMDAAKPGDTVRLLPGVYRERLTLTKGGKYGAPVTLEGMDGAVIEGSENFTPKWTLAPDIAPGVYRTAIEFQPRCIVVDGKQMVVMDENRFADDAAVAKLFKNGFERGGWKYIKGAALYLSKKREVIVRFDKDADPSKMQFVFGPAGAVVCIDGADRIVLRNLELRYAQHGVVLMNTVGSVVEHCYINRTRDAVTLTFGADRCTIRFNRLTQIPLGVNNGGASISEETQVYDTRWTQAWDLWTAHKYYGYYDCKGVNMDRSVGGHRIHDNHIYDHWDAIASRSWEHWQMPAAEALLLADYNRGSDVHHNLIERANDEGLELNDGGIDQQWHHNLIINVRCGVRIKPIEKGPLYLYGNIFKDNAEDIRFYGEREFNPSLVYIYHNSSNAAQAIMSNKVWNIGTPNYHVYNNLFWAERWWNRTGDGVVDPNWKADYNVFVRRGNVAAWDDMRAFAKRLGMETHSRWIEGAKCPYANPAKPDFRIAKNSPARGAGTNLEKLLGIKLPGADDFANISASDSPDAGALPYGAPMLKVPRDPKTVNAEPAGFWPAAGER